MIEVCLDLRCKITGNPCGTDTWMLGHECPCVSCQRWLGRLESAKTAEARAWQEGSDAEWSNRERMLPRPANPYALGKPRKFHAGQRVELFLGPEWAPGTIGQLGIDVTRYEVILDVPWGGEGAYWASDIDIRAKAR